MTPSTHEKSDVNIRLLAYFIAGLFVAGVVTHLGLIVFWKYLGARESSERPVLSRWAGPREKPPAPRLQTSPEHDLQTYLQQQRQRLNSSGVSDAATGATHIPIDRAIDIVLERGLK